MTVPARPWRRARSIWSQDSPGASATATRCRDRPSPLGGVVGVGPGQDLLDGQLPIPPRPAVMEPLEVRGHVASPPPPSERTRLSLAGNARRPGDSITATFLSAI